MKAQSGFSLSLLCSTSVTFQRGTSPHPWRPVNDARESKSKRRPKPRRLRFVKSRPLRRRVPSHQERRPSLQKRTMGHENPVSRLKNVAISLLRSATILLTLLLVSLATLLHNLKLPDQAVVLLIKASLKIVRLARGLPNPIPNPSPTPNPQPQSSPQSSNANGT